MMERLQKVTTPTEKVWDWEVMMLLIADEEKKVDRTGDGEVETMRYFCNNPELKEIYADWMEKMKYSYDKIIDDSDSSTKSDDVALFWRLKGNQKYSEGQFELSFKFYSRSVIFATKNSLMYTFAFANRSAAAFRLQMYAECLKDIKRAVLSNYPLEQRYKLLMRRVDCYIEIGEVEDALDELKDCVQHFKDYTMNRDILQAEFQKKVNQRLEKMQDPEYRTKRKPQFALRDMENKNNRFAHASAAIELNNNETFGRHVVTTRDVKRGDVIFLEQPYAWVTIQDKENLVCDHCCDSETSIIACDDCSRAIYCDESCAYMANLMYHRWECAGGRADIFKSIGIAHLALRVLLMSAHRGFPPYPVNQPVSVDRLFKYYSEVDPVQIYGQEVHPFFRMFNLVSNLEKMNAADHTQYALTATLLVVYLEKYTDFYEFLSKKINVKLSEEELKIFAGALMFRAIGQLISNGHAIVELGCTIHNDIDAEIRRGSAIYPSAAMMNHSCEPNIINVFFKNMLVVKCARELPPNTEVYNCYGPHCARESRGGRREQLREQYHFYCECAACMDDSRKDSIALFSAYACQHCKGPVTWRSSKFRCHNCSNDFSEELARNILFNAGDFEAIAQSKKYHETRIDNMERAYKLKQQVLYRHHTELRKIAGRLAELYAQCEEFNKAVDLIKQNIQSLEFQYGSFSCEVTLEIRKLAHVMIARVPFCIESLELYEEYCREAFQISKKALYLMELNFGSWPRLVEVTKSKLTGLINIVKKDELIDVDNLTRELQETVI